MGHMTLLHSRQQLHGYTLYYCEPIEYAEYAVPVFRHSLVS
jgi:hypothetical protein